MTISKDYVPADPTASHGKWGDWFASEFDPAGLVPWPCRHGVPKADHELLTVQGKPIGWAVSWGRAKYLRHTVWFTDRTHSVVKCIQCIAEDAEETFVPPPDWPR